MKNTQEDDEKTPLLDEEKGQKLEGEEETKPKSRLAKGAQWTSQKARLIAGKAVKVLPGSFIGDLLNKYDYAASYGEHVELACRAAITAMIIGTLLLNPRPPSWYDDTASHLQDLVDPLTLITFYWALGKTFGQSVYNIWGLFVGQMSATAYIWLMFGVFPGGHYPPYTTVMDGYLDLTLLFGVTAGTVFVVGTLYLNIDINTKILALANFIFFWMDFFDNHKNRRSQNWKIETKGTLWLAAVRCLAGCGFGMMVAIIPYPIFAKDKMRQVAKTVANDVGDIWHNVTEGYWNSDPPHPYQLDLLLHDVNSLQGALNTMRQYVSDSWWECFGIGSLESTRNCMRKLINALSKDLDHLPPVLKACSKSMAQNSDEEVESHKRIGEMYLPMINTLIDKTRDLMKLCAEVACTGGPDEESGVELRTKSDDVKRAIDALSDAVTSKRPNTETDEKRLCLDYLDEYTFMFCASHFGRSTRTFANDLLDIQEQKMHLGILRIFTGAKSILPEGIVDKAVLTDPDHIHFVVRNSAAILLAFLVGYHGFPNDMFSSEKMLPKYSPGPSFILTLMLTKFLGSGIQRTLNRSIGTIVGHLAGMALVGFVWRHWYARVITLGLWTGSTVFMFFDCSVNSGVFLLTGIFGATVLIHVCPGENGCTFQYRKDRAMGEIVSCMMALFVMLFVDTCMLARPASQQAAEKIEAVWKALVSTMEQLFDTSQPDTQKQTSSDNMAQELEGCLALSSEAGNEPRFWKTPWREILYGEVVKSAVSMRFSMLCMHYSVAREGKNGAPKADVFLKLSEVTEFKDLGDLLLRRMALITEVIDIFEYTKQSRYPALYDRYLMQGGLADLMVEKVEEFVRIANLPENVWMLTEVERDGGKQDDDSLEQDPICKLSLLLLCIEASMDEMSKMQHNVLMCG